MRRGEGPGPRGSGDWAGEPPTAAAPPLPPPFPAPPADADAVLVKYTYTGDTNLDGRITATDYFALDAGRALGLPGYQHGDFDYSGGVADIDDYLLIDASAMAQYLAAASSAPAPSSPASSSAPMALGGPEPSSKASTPPSPFAPASDLFDSDVEEADPEPRFDLGGAGPEVLNG